MYGFFCLFFKEEVNESRNEDNPELIHRLNKHRRRAAAAVHGRQKSLTSRNSYKDKGGKSSHNSKIQKQLSGW